MKNDEDVKNQNGKHWVGYNKNKKEYVIYPDFLFNNTKNDFNGGRRISKRGYEWCLNNPNQLYVLTDKDKALIKQFLKKTTNQFTIMTIKRKPPNRIIDKNIRVNDQDEVMKLCFTGTDEFQHRHDLSEEWVVSRFKDRRPDEYKKIMALKPNDKAYEITSGYRKLEKNQPKYQSNYPQQSYVQEDDSNCIFFQQSIRFFILVMIISLQNY